MEVKLIAKTVPVVDGLKSAEDLVSYCARVSNPSNQLNTETAGGLLSYCLKHKPMEEWRLGLTFLQKNGLVAC